jgi:hypothetical protein
MRVYSSETRALLRHNCLAQPARAIDKEPPSVAAQWLATQIMR